MNDKPQTRDIACSPSDQALRRRRQVVRRSLLPHLIECQRHEHGLRLTFPDSAALRTEVESFAASERQCRGFPSFAISSSIRGLVVTIDGPPEARPILDMFADTIMGSARKDVSADARSGELS